MCSLYSVLTSRNFFSQILFFQKCCYKWRPRKCLGLDVANLNFLKSNNGENSPWKSQNFHAFFHFLKTNSPSSENLSQQNKHCLQVSKKVNNQINMKSPKVWKGCLRENGSMPLACHIVIWNFFQRDLTPIGRLVDDN